ncbi:MAG: DUF1699 family protein [Methanosarcinaceae archaeon]|nr:DUF1699 family protein [Methanosarcinaceae archaeon]
MKIRIVSKRNEIEDLDEGEKVIHLAFRPSNEDIFKLVMTCRNIEVIQIPTSYRRTVSKTVETFLDIRNIQLIEGDVWGHRKDIDEYYSISPEIMGKIQDMKVNGSSDEEIAAKLSQEGKLKKDMLLYILGKD